MSTHLPVHHRPLSHRSGYDHHDIRHPQARTALHDDRCRTPDRDTGAHIHEPIHPGTLPEHLHHSYCCHSPLPSVFEKHLRTSFARYVLSEDTRDRKRLSQLYDRSYRFYPILASRSRYTYHPYARTDRRIEQ